ncbi:MAG: aspartate aminotransferase family protein [Coriobacteriia bacterium]
MGIAFESAAALDAAFHMRTYARKPVMFVRGEGMRLYDDDGREYLDFVAGIGSVNLGHSHPGVAEAVSTQMSRLVQVSNLYHVEHRAELAADLVGLAGFDGRVFFANSGAEATEGAIKLARRWGRDRHGPECVEVVSALRSFHGRTLAALAATGQPAKQEAFEPLPAGFRHVPLGDTDALEVAITPRTCAVMLEPIQGEGGVFPCAPEYLAAARRLCDERGVLLVLDEVQTGFWRTGPVFAHLAMGVEPDVMTLAKSMANGLPIGAVVARADVAEAFRPGDHGSTFGGGPVICAAGRATIAALAAERLGENAVATGTYLRERLSALAAATGAVASVRGAGLMLAIDLASPVAVDITVAALHRGLVLNSIGDRTIRFLPPLVCGRAEVDTLADILADLLEGV